MNGLVVVDTDGVSSLSKGDTRAKAYRQHLHGKTLAVPSMAVAPVAAVRTGSSPHGLLYTSSCEPMTR